MTKDEQREQMRRNFPDTAELIDLKRIEFGDDTEVLWCSENAKEVGKQTWK